MTRRSKSPAGSAGVFRRAGVSVGMLGLVLALMGCASGGAGGQSNEAAETALLAIPGVIQASVDTKSITSGLQKETSTTVKVSLDTGFSAPDPGALVDYLLQVAWSTATKEADSSMRVQVAGDPQISVLDALEAAGWGSRSGDPNSPERAVVEAAEVKKRFGDWPGDVPELPAGLIVDSTP